MQELEKILDEMKKIKDGNRKEKLYAKYPPNSEDQKVLNAYSQGYEDGTDNFYNAVTDIIRKHLSRENEPEIERYSRDNAGWIPVEERLPEIYRMPEEDDECPEFNVTIRGAEEATTLKYSPADSTWFDDYGYVYDVIAWRPLPEPYRPERNEHDR